MVLCSGEIGCGQFSGVPWPVGSSVQWSPLTSWVVRGAWGMVPQKSSSSLFCGRLLWGMVPQKSSSSLFCGRLLWAVLAWAGMSSLWLCPSSIPLLTTVSPTFQRVLKDGFGEAFVVHDMPEACKFPSLQQSPEEVPVGPQGCEVLLCIKASSAYTKKKVFYTPAIFLLLFFNSSWISQEIRERGDMPPILQKVLQFFSDQSWIVDWVTAHIYWFLSFCAHHSKFSCFFCFVCLCFMISFQVGDFTHSLISNQFDFLYCFLQVSQAAHRRESLETLLVPARREPGWSKQNEVQSNQTERSTVQPNRMKYSPSPIGSNAG